MNRRSFLRGLGIGLLTLNSLTGIKGLIGALNPPTPPTLNLIFSPLVDWVFKSRPFLPTLQQKVRTLGSPSQLGTSCSSASES